MSSSDEDLLVALDAIRRQYGDDTIDYASKSPDVRRIQTGSIELDYAMGGGLPVGRFTRLYGGYHSGKSLLCWHFIKNAQKAGLSCAYYNIEKQFDRRYVESLGVDVDKLLVVQGTVIEEVVAKMEALLGPIDMHVIDSTSSAVSIETLKGNVEDQTIGLNARVWSRGLARLLHFFDPDRNVGVFVSQVRDQIGGMGGAKPDGGRALEHASSMSCNLRKGAWLWHNKDGILMDEQKHGSSGMSGLKDPDGYEIVVRIDKSRVGTAYRSARLYYDLNARKLDVAYEFAKAARHFSVVDQAGSWYTLPDGTRVQGETQLRKAIIDDLELRNVIYDTVMEQA